MDKMEAMVGEVVEVEQVKDILNHQIKVLEQAEMVVEE
jgi:hypothetical protein